MSSYIPIASQTLSSSATAVNFTSIPTTLNGKTLRDLVLVCYVIQDFSIARMRFNSSTSFNYETVTMSGSGSGTDSRTASLTSYMSLQNQPVYTSTNGGITILNVFDYAQTNKHKSVLIRNDYSSQFGTQAAAGSWSSTDAISSINLFVASDTFRAGSTFSLYGIEG